MRYFHLGNWISFTGSLSVSEIYKDANIDCVVEKIKTSAMSKAGKCCHVTKFKNWPLLNLYSLEKNFLNKLNSYPKI